MIIEGKLFNHLPSFFVVIYPPSSFPSSCMLLLAHIMPYHSTADEGLAILDLEIHVRSHPPASEAGVGI